jgi:hypothetical protein
VVRSKLADTFEQTFDLDPGIKVMLAVRELRRERTGLHGRLALNVNGHGVYVDTFNLGRGPSGRTPFVRECLKRLQDMGEEIALAALDGSKLAILVDHFCVAADDFMAHRLKVDLLPGSDPGPVRFCLTPWIIQGGGTIIFGPPGRGKSYLAMLMAVSVDAGLPTLWPVEQAGVLFLNLERSQESLARRLLRINRALGLDPLRPLRVADLRGQSLAANADALADFIKAEGVEIAFLDSISRTQAGDLRDNEPANAIIDTLNGVCGTWLALGHSPRKDESHVFGSVHFTAGADVEVQLLSQVVNDGNTLGLGLQATKANDIRLPPLELVALDFGDDDESLNVRRPYQSEFPEIGAGRTMPRGDQVVELIKAMGVLTAEEIAAHLGMKRNHVSSLLANDRRFQLAGKDGRKHLYGLAAPKGIEEGLE